jgi:hypothetical protein
LLFRKRKKFSHKDTKAQKRIGVQGFKGSEVQGCISVPGLHFGDIFECGVPGFVIANLKVEVVLVIILQNQ